MEAMYNRHRLELYEKRAQAGKKLAYQADLARDRCRHTGKILKVVSFPQGGDHVPSVRVAGKWLERFGFEPGAEVVLTATEGQILITRKEDYNHGSSLV